MSEFTNRVSKNVSVQINQTVRFLEPAIIKTCVIIVAPLEKTG